MKPHRLISPLGLFVLFGLGFVAVQAPAAEVLKVDKNQRLMAVTHTRDRRWKQGDYLCVVKREKEVACGPTVKATSRGAIVRFDFQSGGRVYSGDPVEFYLFPPESLKEQPTPTPLASGEVELPASPLPGAETEKQIENSLEKAAPGSGDGKDATKADLSSQKSEEEEEEATPTSTPTPSSSATPTPSPSPAPAPSATPAPTPTPVPSPTPSPTPLASASPTPEPSPSASPVAAADDWVDLDAMDSGPPPEAQKAPGTENASAATAKSPHARSGTKPKFRMMFDWLLAYRSFTRPRLTFDKYHTLLLFEIRPAPKLYFGFEVSPSPRYYELNYELSRKFTIRAGKISMPFDDLSPHSYFGGRINISRLTPPGSTAFLPDFWADLGVAMRYRIVYTKSMEWTLDLAITNGFGEGPGQNPVNSTALYPEFAQANVAADNNRDKAFTVRTAMGLFGDKLSFGASAYRGRYSNQANPSAYVNMIGIDARARVGGAELRGGYVFMLVDTPGQITESFRRGGVYGEFSMYLDKRDKWRWLVRGGMVQHDSRVVANSDQILGGTQLSYRYGPVTVAMEYDLDVHNFAGKPENYMAGMRVTFGL